MIKKIVKKLSGGGNPDLLAMEYAKAHDVTHNPNICFVVALRSRQSTDKWSQVLNDFNNTLRSIFNQTCPDFQVYVGCNEIPELEDEYDERLHFVTADLPIPNTWEEKCRDRSWKLCLCAKKIREEYQDLLASDNGIYIFPVDADDFVNCRIAEYVANHPDANGFKSANGYKWIKGSFKMEITPYFGGSMNIMKMYKDDLPAELPEQSLCFDKETAIKLTERYPIRWYDIEVEHKFAELGRPLERLPFKSTVYVLGTGANISNSDPHNLNNGKEFHPIAFLRSINPLSHRKVTTEIKKEFGMI